MIYSANQNLIICMQEEQLPGQKPLCADAALLQSHKYFPDFDNELL